MRVFSKYLTLAVFISATGIFLGLSGCGPAEEESSDVQQSEEIPKMPSSEPITEERVFYGFESSLKGWEIPMWAKGKNDYVAQSLELSEDFSSHGSSSLKVMCDFPGGKWAAALVEIQQYLNLSFYRVIRADVYLPEEAPMGLDGSIILTVGENWKFIEMARSIPLVPGQWVTITANVEPGSYDWRRIVPDEEFAQDVRKIAIRVVSNNKPQYTGPVYIDNVRAGR